MPKRVPISIAKTVAKQAGLKQVILLGWDGALTHVVTYGESVEDCAQAAAGGNALKAKWGWPECNDQPSRVKVLLRDTARMKEALHCIVAALGDERPSEGYFPMRRFLEKRGIFHEDLGDERVLVEVCKIGLGV